MAPRPPNRRAPEVALAVYAHPDDPDLACGGTLAGWAASGTRVVVVSVAVGDKGGTSPDPELVGVREAEARAAGRVVGISEWRSLGRLDGELDNDLDLRRDLVRVVREVGPQIVLTSDPTAAFFGGHYVNHRDHRECGWATCDAVAPASWSGAYFPECGEPHRVEEIWLSGTLEPDHWIDIGSTIDTKVAALACHRSQLADGLELGEGGAAGDDALVEELVRHRATLDGRQGGMALAEGYRRLVLA